MSEKPKRRWFRFQLLTLVLMALASGGMMALNTLQQPVHGINRYGWPCIVLTHYIGLRGFDWDRAGNLGADVSDQGNLWNWPGLFVDTGGAMAIIIGAALLAESLIRSRENRKP